MNEALATTLNAYERHTLVRCLANASGLLTHGSREADRLANWLVKNLSLLRGEKDLLSELKELLPDQPDERDCCGRSRPAGTLSAAQWEQLKSCLDTCRTATTEVPLDRVGRHLQRLAQSLGLSPEDVSILDLLLRYEVHSVFDDLLGRLTPASYSEPWCDDDANLNINSRAFPMVLGMTRSAFRQRFDARGTLAQSGLIAFTSRHEVRATRRLFRLVTASDESTDVRRLLLSEARAAELEWSDFDHLGQDRDDVAAIMKGALADSATGVNILIHGPPGTGKTAFCSTLAQELDIELFSVGETGEDGTEPEREHRLAELRLSQRLLTEDANSVLLFDEMDDLLAESGRRHFASRRRRRTSDSKVFLNRLLETNPCPILWITNDATSIDPAILRRMMFALEVRHPPSLVRARVWTRQLARHRIEATKEDALALAREFNAAPGVAAGATAAANLGGGDINLVRRSVHSLSRVLGCEISPRQEGCVFDPALVEADMDINALADRLTQSGNLRFSICLQGPPGTGKSAYVRHLAERIGLEALQQRASDLLSMWVGATEKRIARIFRRAADEGAFLIFDEADSLLADRRRARRSWEVSQVNEMLTWMESHPLPFACTTNHGANLDPATLRRFIFKVRLDYMKPASAAAAFRLFFDSEPPVGLDSLTLLTPGDFAVVRRKAEALGQCGDPAALLALLRVECRAKSGRRKRIGFAA